MFDRVGRDVSIYPPTALTSSINTTEAASSICDNTGNLLFYTDGVDVFDRTHNVMANGTGLNGHTSSSQGVLIVQKPGSQSLYYVFTLDAQILPNGLQYSIVDMSLAAGNGSVTVKNVPVYTPSTEKLTATKHCNGVDIWIVTHEIQSNTFRAYLLTSSGLNMTPVISSAGLTHGLNQFAGQMKISPNSKKLGMAFDQYFELLDFDASSGVVANAITLITTGQGRIPYGCEFSEDGSKFYGSVGAGLMFGGSSIHQWDLCAGSPAAIVSSQYSIAIPSNTIWTSAMQRAPNGNIYISKVFPCTDLAGIMNPNLPGAACNYIPSAFSIAPKMGNFGLPNYMTINPHFPPPPITHTVSNTGCYTANFTSPSVNHTTLAAGCVVNGYSLTGCLWNFGDPASGAANTSGSFNPSHAFTSQATYTTQLILYYSCGGGTDTLYTTVSFTPCISIVSDPVTCVAPGSATVAIAGTTGAYNYTWLPSGQTGSVATGLSPGTHSVITFDYLNNATYTTTISLVPPSLSVSAVGATVCAGQTLSLSSNSLPGSVYYWSGPAGFTSAVQNPVIQNPGLNTAGTYSVFVTNSPVCSNSAVASVSVISPPSLSVMLSSNSLCAQAFNGSPNTITLTSSGAATYTLSTPNHITNSNPSGPTSSISIAPPYSGGLATATLQGSNGVCTVTTMVSFSIIPNPTISVNSLTPVICSGQSYTYTNHGAASYTWNSSTPGLTTYSTGQVAVANPSITSVFSVYGGSLGCNSAIQTTTITVNPLPTVTITPVTPIICMNDRITLMGLGTGNTYTWSPAIGLNATNNATVSAGPLNQQQYTLTTSLNSCTASAAITVSVLPVPSPSVYMAKTAVCLKEQVILEGAGGEMYQWYGPAGIQLTGKTVKFTPQNISAAGIYTLIVTGPNSCRNSTLFNLDVRGLPEGHIQGSLMRGCVPFDSKFKANLTGAAKASWRLNQVTYRSDTFTVRFKEPGTYSFIGILIDSVTGCSNTNTVTIEAYPLPRADFSYLPEVPVESLEDVIFTNTSTGEEQVKWNWFFLNNQGYRASGEHTSYFFQDAGIYPVAMVVTNKWFCSDTIIKAVKVEPDFAAYVPDVFTPNADGRNDVFLPVLRGVRLYELSIYNRYGVLMFFTKDPQTGWDGTYKEEACKMDVYVWKMTLSSQQGILKKMTGHVTLER